MRQFCLECSRKLPLDMDIRERGDHHKCACGERYEAVLQEVTLGNPEGGVGNDNKFHPGEPFAVKLLFWCKA